LNGNSATIKVQQGLGLGEQRERHREQDEHHKSFHKWSVAAALKTLQPFGI